MPRPCAVCAHLDRAIIDAQLARHVCNVSAVARTYGLSRKSCETHRHKHLPTFLRMYGANAQLPTLGELHGEYVRLHSAALDALALAQAGTLERIDDDGVAHHKVSVTSISRAISEARKTVDSIARLAADAAEENERPSGMVNGELTERIRTQLERVVSRALNAPVADDLSHPDAISGAASSAPLTAAPGGQGVEAGVPSPPQVSLDAAMPFSTAQVSPLVAQVVRDDQSSTIPAATDPAPLFRVPNPRYPGSPAASEEERTASGYPDMLITIEDLKSRPELLQLLAEKLS